MKFLATALAAVLGAEAVLAGPVNLVPREPRMTKRRALRKTSPRIAAEGEEMVALSSNGSQVSYSSNWAGAVLIGSGYQSVVGTITVPTPKAPSGWQLAHAVRGVGVGGHRRRHVPDVHVSPEYRPRLLGKRPTASLRCN